MTLPVVELIGNPRAESRTRRLADAVTAAVLDALRGNGTSAHETHVLELGELVGVTFGPEPAHGSGAVTDPFGLVRAARLLVVATPTYKATYSGLLKVFLDQFTQGDLSGAVAIPVAVAGIPAHRESVQEALRALLVELGASVAAPAVAVLESDLGVQESDDIAAWWAGRYAAVVGDTLDGLAALAETSGDSA